MLLLGQWIDLIMFKEKGSEKDRSEIDNESKQAYQTLVDWVKTVPNTIDELKKNGNEDDLRKYQLQIKMVLNKLKEIQKELRNDKQCHTTAIIYCIVPGADQNNRCII